MRPGVVIYPGNDLLSHPVTRAVPSALEGLTSVFGMGTGVTPPPWSPGTVNPTNREGGEEPGKNGIYGQAARPISTGKLNPFLGLHLRPINLVIFEGPLGGLRHGRPDLEVGFPLRCFQRLSRPNIATQRCPWRDNWYTRGSSVPVLSY